MVGYLKSACWGVVSRLREQILLWFMPEMHKWLSLVYSSSPCPDSPTNPLKLPHVGAYMYTNRLALWRAAPSEERGCTCVGASLWHYPYESLHLDWSFHD